MEEIFKMIGHVTSLIPLQGFYCLHVHCTAHNVSSQSQNPNQFRHNFFGDEGTCLCHTLIASKHLSVYNKCINCFFTTNSNLFCHFSLAIYATWFLYNPRLNDCKCSFSSKCMNTFFEWNTIWSRILIVKKHTIEEDALED